MFKKLLCLVGWHQWDNPQGSYHLDGHIYSHYRQCLRCNVKQKKYTFLVGLVGETKLHDIGTYWRYSE